VSYYSKEESARRAKDVADAKAGRTDPPAKAGDRVPCTVCSGRGYIYSLHHVVCRVCKGTRVVTIEEYR
jgi:DnaJ-class molecular chaperone